MERDGAHSAQGVQCVCPGWAAAWGSPSTAGTAGSGLQEAALLSYIQLMASPCHRHPPSSACGLSTPPCPRQVPGSSTGSWRQNRSEPLRLGIHGWGSLSPARRMEQARPQCLPTAVRGAQALHGWRWAAGEGLAGGAWVRPC